MAATDPLRLLLRASTLLVVLLLTTTSVDAVEQKVYRYRTTTGAVGHGSEVPPGARILETVGTIQVPIGELLAQRFRTRAVWNRDLIEYELRHEPIVAAAIAVALVLVALLTLRAIPPLFSTRELLIDGAVRMLCAIAAAVATLALIGLGIDVALSSVGYEPDDATREGLDVLGWLSYAAVITYAFHKRLTGRLVAAMVLGAGWLLALASSAAVLWVFVAPSMTPHV